MIGYRGFLRRVRALVERLATGAWKPKHSMLLDWIVAKQEATMPDPDEARGRDPIDAWITRSLWTASVRVLVTNPGTTADLIVSAFMLELSKQPGLLVDSEGFERAVRRLMVRLFPLAQRNAAAIRVELGGPSA